MFVKVPQGKTLVEGLVTTFETLEYDPRACGTSHTLGRSWFYICDGFWKNDRVISNLDKFLTGFLGLQEGCAC